LTGLDRGALLAAMEFALHRPAPPLDRFVETITFYAGFAPSHDREKLIPDGAIQIIVDLTDTPKKLYAGDTAPEAVDFRRAWISGMHLKPIVIEAQPGASMLVIRFQPGAAHAFLRHAADAMTDSVFTFEDVVGRAATSLRDRLLEAPSAAAKIAAAEAWLWEQVPEGPEVDPVVTYLSERLRQPGTRVAALAEETGYTTRHVLSLFRRWIGVTPKQYARIRRFQQVLASLAQPGGYDPALDGERLPEPDWATLAMELRYADQSHFVHEFRAFSGMTPGAYIAAYRGLENYLPITLPR
jgi:AraC-like DNA-binding protein